MKAKKWLVCWFSIVGILVFLSCLLVVYMDPFFHYHKPLVDKFYYTLDNQRSQNDGISKHYDYDAIITGTSMTELFRPSEMDKLFDVNTVKLPYSGASFNEINDCLSVALSYNPDTKMVVRSLDRTKLFDDPDLLRTDLGDYPTYLYDNNPINDVYYLLNKDVIINRILPMLLNTITKEYPTGVMSFDKYSQWTQYHGTDRVYPGGFDYNDPSESHHLSDEDKKVLEKNITQNVTQLADQYPNTTFYCFYTPYSIAWWSAMRGNGLLEHELEAEKYITELLLKHNNIRLFSLDTRTDIITDLNNYSDMWHYARWVNSLILKVMSKGECELTADNYLDYFIFEEDFFSNFDYSSIPNQENYSFEDDLIAEALLRKEIYDIEPLNLLDCNYSKLVNANLEIRDNTTYLLCSGCLSYDNSSDISAAEYMYRSNYSGIRVDIPDIGKYDYIIYYGRKIQGCGQPHVCIYDENENVILEQLINSDDIDNSWIRYFIDISELSGNGTIIINGACENASIGSPTSEYEFRDFYLY